MKIYIIMVFVICCISSCTPDERDNWYFSGGLYEYLLLDPDSYAILDTVYSIESVNKVINNDSIFVFNDFLRNILITEGKIFGTFFNSNEDELLFYKIHSFNLSSGDQWSLEDEIGPVLHFPVVYRCIAVDSTIEYRTNKFEDITIIEERSFINVGGMWDVFQYGFDKDRRIVYVRNFIEIDEEHEWEFKFFMVLNEFMPKKELPTERVKAWRNKNSDKVKKLLFREIDDNKLLQLPPTWEH